MIDETIQVGKYTLESLTTGMYSDPKIVYREYIQNSVDSLENALAIGLIERQSMRIDIIVDTDNSYISIRDNGTGISSEEAKATLLNVGNSKKRSSSNRGFRGIGRLGGMSYCDTLVFSTSSENEKTKTVVTFDCKRLRKLLIPGQYEDLSLSAVLEQITTIETLSEKEEKHYFVVEMKDVSSFSDLLDIDSVKSYISQVAPLPYQSRHFIYTSQLKSFLDESGYSVEEFPVFVGEDEADLEPIYKPNTSKFRSDRNKKTVDEITSLSFFDVKVGDELYALGWYGNCGWYGFLSDKELCGIRLRKGNILIGDSKTLNGIFREARFNGWTQGEIFILTDKLIPNARRDDFEQNNAYRKLIEILSDTIGTDIPKKIREASTTRNDPSTKVLKEVDKTISDSVAVMTEGFNSSVDKDQIVEQLTEAAKLLEKTSVKPEFKAVKDDLRKKIDCTIEEVSESKNYKINQISSAVDKKSKQILRMVTDILSQKLSKILVDEIIEEIITAINGK